MPAPIGELAKGQSLIEIAYEVTLITDTYSSHHLFAYLTLTYSEHSSIRTSREFSDCAY